MTAPPCSMPKGYAGGLTALTVCLLGAIAATWPLLLHVQSAIPIGTEREATVPLFNLWTLWWTADRVGHGFQDYWNAPVFYPNRGVFTYSEPQPLTGLALWPLWAAGFSPAVIYNIALLLILTLNGWCAFRLFSVVPLSSFASVLGGLLVATLPFMTKLLGVLPLLPIFGVIWTLEGLVRFSQTKQLRYAVWAAAGYVGQVLMSQQLALMSTPLIGVAGFLTFWRLRQERRALIHLIVAGLLATAVVGGVSVPILSLHRYLDFERPVAVVHALSAAPSDYLTRPGNAVVPFPSEEPLDRDTAGLFPGLVVLVLAAGALLDSFRTGMLRGWCSLAAAMVALSFLLSLGLNLSIGSWRPFETLRSVVPGFSQLRSPFRFAVFTQLGLCLLATVSLHRLAEQSSRVFWRHFVLAVGILAPAENLAVPIQLVDIPETPRTEWTLWLKARQDPTIVAHIPFAAGPHVSHYEIDAWRQFAQIDHQKPLINGYSGFFPPGYLRFQLDMARDFPTVTLLCILSTKLSVNTVIVDESWLHDHGARIRAFNDVLDPLYRDDRVSIFGLTPPASGCRDMLDRSGAPERH